MPGCRLIGNLTMQNNFIELSRGGIAALLAVPGTYYKGTRFDWNGIFRSIQCGGIAYADTWYDNEDAFRHDNVCGPSEEFSPVWLSETRCLKPGVGILEVPQGKGSYDRFKLYKVVECGKFDVSVKKDCAVFTHILEGYYRYTKIVSLEEGCRLNIKHTICWDADFTAEVTCYNHNFLTMGKNCVGPSREFVFDAPVDGTWRSDSVSGYKDGNKLRFERIMLSGEKCFIEKLTLSDKLNNPYHFTVCESSCQVDVRCDKPMEYATFWSNHRVACVEPYVLLTLTQGSVITWNIEYTFKTFENEKDC